MCWPEGARPACCAEGSRFLGGGWSSGAGQGGAAGPRVLPGRLLTSSSAPQVKNFGRSGRTKYTHLVDQDTTSFDSAWGQESAQNTKFFKQKAAGVRDVFERPSAKKRKTT